MPAKHVETYECAVLLDFDTTIMLTAKPSPNGIGVPQAYELAVKDAFGTAGLDHYQKSGGLHNRAPAEVVEELTAAGYSSACHAAVLTDYLVAMKLKYMMDEIGKRLSDGTIWPNVTPGFPSFWRFLGAHPKVYTGVLSSGHDDFIKKAFGVHDLHLPHQLVTDDILRPMGLAKPDARLYGVIEQRAGFVLPKAKTIYVGDDPNKDGQFAANCGIPFYQIVPEEVNTLLSGEHTFSHWSTLSSRLARFWAS